MKFKMPVQPRGEWTDPRNRKLTTRNLSGMNLLVTRVEVNPFTKIAMISRKRADGRLFFVAWLTEMQPCDDEARAWLAELVIPGVV